MSIKSTIAHGLDQTRLAFLGDKARQIALTPVFHVEQLFNDTYYHNLSAFLKGYRALTSKRAVVTCMTPHSPILAFQMRQADFGQEQYWERIAEIGQDGIVGLHGHFVRAPLENSSPMSVRPMHYAFHNLKVVEDQISQELEDLHRYGLVKDELLIYSAGWWFMTPQLRKILAQFKFQWDYSLSSSPYNISPGASMVETRVTDEGLCSQTIGGHEIRSATAVCGIAHHNRPFNAVGKLLAEARRQGGKKAVLSLYAHDFDLNLAAGLRMTERFCQAGFNFCEPR